MIEEIKELHKQVKDKTGFYMDLSEVVNRSPKTLRAHWFSRSGFWSIPEELELTVRDFMVEYVKDQKATA